MEPPKDTESYIHRSGRTARAGKGGTCITFYNSKTFYLIGQIETKAGIKLKTVGAPQPKDIIQNSCKDVVKGLKKVDPGALPAFTKAAEEFIAEVGATEAVSMALAYISGQTKKLKSRSAMSGEEGKETIKMNCGTEVRSNGYAFTQLERITTPRVIDMLENVKMLADRSGVVFDLPTAEAARLMESYKTQKVRAGIKFALEQVDELPKIIESGGRRDHGGSGFQRSDKSRKWGEVDSEDLDDNLWDWKKAPKTAAPGDRPRKAKAPEPARSKPSIHEETKTEEVPQSAGGFSFGKGKPTFFKKGQ